MQNDLFTAITEDGSISLVSAEYGELYHNLVGAYTEALCNYSQVAYSAWGIIYGDKFPAGLNVLDCCFGLGYNSFVLAQQLPPGVHLDITGIELDPSVLDFLPQVLAQSCFKALAQAGFGPTQAIELSQSKKSKVQLRGGNSVCSINLIQSCLRNYFLKLHDGLHNQFDLVLHDPFSPKRMPELWTIDLFAVYKQVLKTGGMILTYSSAPAVRGALLDLGFHVYRTPALGGKWGGTLAINGDHLEKSIEAGGLSDQVLHLSEAELERLAKSSRVPYRDPGLDGQREQIVQAREAEQQTFGRADIGRPVINLHLLN